VIPSHERRIAELFSGLVPDEQSDLLKLLRKLDHSLA
jgi:DNA-binding MarR family transcriptional regulator